MKSNFPKNFWWGASSAGHQYEGGNHNQWSVWELAHAVELAKEAEKRLNWIPVWEEIKEQAQKPENYVSGLGVDHYNRYKEDFKIIRELNLNAFRFSIEWSRIEPEEGEWDQDAIRHYKDYIVELRRLGIEPFINLWHWTHPVWFEDKGGFENKSNLKYFDRFVQKISEELIDDVNYVLTINEANNYMTFGYILGMWVPQKKNVLKALKVYYNLALAHRRAYKILKRVKPGLSIGVAHNAVANFPLNPRNPLQKIVARFSDYFWDGWYYGRINKYQDFVGANYYFTNYWKDVHFDNPKKPLNDLGWYMEPARIYDVALRLSRKYKKPVIITENGVADQNDIHRKWWIEETMAAIARAREEGADIVGYFHWSLLDNFEWSEGWWPKFGLVAVDRENNMKRTIKPSAEWWASWLKQQANK